MGCTAPAQLTIPLPVLLTIPSVGMVKSARRAQVDHSVGMSKKWSFDHTVERPFFSFSVGFEQFMETQSPNLTPYFPEPDLQNLCFRTVFHPICYEYVDIPQCDGPCEEKIAFCLDKTCFFLDFRKITTRPVGKIMKKHWVFKHSAQKVLKSIGFSTFFKKSMKWGSSPSRPGRPQQ